MTRLSSLRYISLLSILILVSVVSVPSAVHASAQTVTFFPTIQPGHTAFVATNRYGSGLLGWADARNASIGDLGDDTGYIACDGCTGEVDAENADNEFYVVARSILSFDTSSLPENAVITSVALHIRPATNGSRSTGDNNEYTYVQPVGPATPQNPSDLTLDDFDQSGALNNPTRWSDTKIYWSDPWNSVQDVIFNFNQDGINGIVKDGLTILALREGHDIEDVMPDAYNVWRFSAENSYLEVTYEIPEIVTNAAVEKAKAVIGGPYTLGAKGWDFPLKKYLDPAQIKSGELYTNHDSGLIKGLDCSGLTLWAYDSVLNPSIFPIHDNGTDDNIIKYQSADGQYHHNVELVANGSEQPGDLMFFDWNHDGGIDHVALYVGDQGGYDVVHASSPSVGIISAQKSNLAALPGFVGFGRVNDPRVKMSMKTHSPVDLLVTDPQGFTISATTSIITDEEINREVPGELYYSVYDIASDNTPETEVYSPKLKMGDYIVKPVRRADAATSSVYSITVDTDFGTLTLANHVPVTSIPVGGYVVRVTATGVTAFVRDITAPEARISVDPATKDLRIDGVDETSTTTVTKSANNTYLITDAAGNTTTLFFQKSYAGKLLTYAKLTGVQYNNNPVIAVAKSSFLYLWNPLVNPPVLLSQTIVVDDTFGIEAVYDKKKNQTTVFVKKKNVVLQKQVVTGLRIVTLTTSKGVMGYSI